MTSGIRENDDREVAATPAGPEVACRPNGAIASPTRPHEFMKTVVSIHARDFERSRNGRPGRQAVFGDPKSAFTLVELLTVIGVVAIFAGVVLFPLRGGDRSEARDAAVSTLSSLVAAARGIAALKGVNGALFVGDDTSSPDRYRRYVVVCVEDTSTGKWEPVDAGVMLPVGIYILTKSNPLPTDGPGLYKNPGDLWTRPSGGELRSTALATNTTQTVNSDIPEAWSYVAFTPRGTLATGTAGDIVVAGGRPESGGAQAAILVDGPDNVGGMSISAYGSVTILRHREDF